MKLNKIIFALLTLTVLAACSNDSDEPKRVSGPKAMLSVAVKALDPTTKAVDDPNALPGEMNINHLTALVFDETGTQRIGYKSEAITTTDGTGTLEEIETIQVKAQIVVIANAPADAFEQVETLEECRSVLADLQSQRRTNLTMSTSVIASEEPLAAEGNYIGFEDKTNINNLDKPVLLTRIAARIDVKSIGVSFTEDRLKGRTVRIDGLYIANAKTASNFFSLEEWGGVEAEGHLAYGPGAEAAEGVIAEGAAAADYLTASPAEAIKDGTSVSNVISWYTFENLSGTAPTQIVIKATLLAEGNAPEETAYFHTVINPNGKNLRYDHDYIKRNYIYRLVFVFSDSSFNGKEPEATVNCLIEVLPWNVVSQDSEVTD